MGLLDSNGDASNQNLYALGLFGGVVGGVWYLNRNAEPSESGIEDKMYGWGDKLRQRRDQREATRQARSAKTQRLAAADARRELRDEYRAGPIRNETAAFFDSTKLNPVNQGATRGGMMEARRGILDDMRRITPEQLKQLVHDNESIQGYADYIKGQAPFFKKSTVRRLSHSDALQLGPDMKIGRGAQKVLNQDLNHVVSMVGDTAKEAGLSKDVRMALKAHLLRLRI